MAQDRDGLPRSLLFLASNSILVTIKTMGIWGKNSKPAGWNVFAIQIGGVKGDAKGGIGQVTIFTGYRFFGGFRGSS